MLDPPISCVGVFGTSSPLVSELRLVKLELLLLLKGVVEEAPSRGMEEVPAAVGWRALLVCIATSHVSDAGCSLRETVQLDTKRLRCRGTEGEACVCEPLPAPHGGPTRNVAEHSQLTQNSNAVGWKVGMQMHTNYQPYDTIPLVSAPLAVQHALSFSGTHHIVTRQLCSYQNGRYSRAACHVSSSCATRI